MRSRSPARYLPNSQGRTPLPAKNSEYGFLAMVPGIHMYREALMAGVPLKPITLMRDDERRNFTPSDDLIAAYNDYIAAEPSSGSTDEILSKRMDRYRFYRFRKLDTFVSEARAHGSPIDDAHFLEVTNEHFKYQCGELQRKHANAHREADHARAIADARWLSGDRSQLPERPPSAIQNIKRDVVKEDLELWQAMHRVGETPPALTKLFDLYVNDSIAGFAQDSVDEFKINGRGHLRNRDVFDKGGT